MGRGRVGLRLRTLVDNATASNSLLSDEKKCDIMFSNDEGDLP